MSGTSLIGRVEDVEGTLSLDSSGNPVLDQKAKSASTYGVMQARIADEMEDAQTTVQVQNAILDAIRSFARMRFWFNELLDDGSMSTVAGQEYYTGDQWLPVATRPHIDTLAVVAYNTRYVLSPRTQQFLEEIATNPFWRGMPTDWSYIGGSIRLYPIPDNAYPLRISGTVRLPEPAQSSDTSAWFVEAERLIRAEAKRRLHVHVTRDAASAQAMAQEAQFELQQLLGETADRVPGPMRVRPRRF